MKNVFLLSDIRFAVYNLTQEKKDSCVCVSTVLSSFEQLETNPERKTILFLPIELYSLVEQD